jgi:hypothetical protein
LAGVDIVRDWAGVLAALCEFRLLWSLGNR